MYTGDVHLACICAYPSVLQCAPFDKFGRKMCMGVMKDVWIECYDVHVIYEQPKSTYCQYWAIAARA